MYQPVSHAVYSLDSNKCVPDLHFFTFSTSTMSMRSGDSFQFSQAAKVEEKEDGREAKATRDGVEDPRFQMIFSAINYKPPFMAGFPASHC